MTGEETGRVTGSDAGAGEAAALLGEDEEGDVPIFSVMTYPFFNFSPTRESNNASALARSRGLEFFTPWLRVEPRRP
jgi:hypothetical protein